MLEGDKPVICAGKSGLIQCGIDESWFWTPYWQEKERQSEEDIKAGRVKGFDSVEELIDDLNREECG